MVQHECDIFISGGGIAGLSAAGVFAAAGFSVICADPAPQITDPEAEAADQRSTAILAPGRALLAEAGLWTRLERHATPLEIMRLKDISGGRDVTRDFEAADLDQDAFGWNFPNWLLRREILAGLAEMTGVTLLGGVGTTDMLTRDEAALVTLSDGTRLRARLVVAADGRGSPLRRIAGIETHVTRYGQKAVVFSVTHPIPHGNVSTEVHRSGGPFTLVPLPDREGLPSSAVVWMEEAQNADDLNALSDTDLAAAASERSGYTLGPLEIVTRRAVWPIITQEASRLTDHRLALIAEAGHVVPPIGAQGLNMSLADIACLRDLARTAPDQLGAKKMLDAYARKRLPDIRLRSTGIMALNRASMAGASWAQNLRASGMKALHDVRPIRRALMELGLGARAGRDQST